MKHLGTVHALCFSKIPTTSLYCTTPVSIPLAPPSVLAKIEKPMETFVSLAPRVEGSCRVIGNADRGEGAIIVK